MTDGFDKDGMMNYYSYLVEAEKNKNSITKVEEVIIDDKVNKILFHLLSKDGLILKHIPDSLITKELCLAALNNNVDTILYVPKKYIDLDMAKYVVRNNYQLIYIIPSEFYLDIVSDDGMAIHYIKTGDLTLELVRAAISQNGEAIQWLPKEFKTSELCVLSIDGGNRQLKYIPEEHWPVCVLRMNKYKDTNTYIA